MKFTFKAKNASGQLREAEIEAVSRETAIETLQKTNFIPFFVEESAS